MRKELEKKKAQLAQDTTSVYFIVYNSSSPTMHDDRRALLNYYKRQNLVVNICSEQLAKKSEIDIDKLQVSTPKYKFKYRSDFPEGRKLWRTEYDFYLAACLNFHEFFLILHHRTEYGMPGIARAL